MQPKRLPEPSVTVASALTVPLRKILYFDLILFTKGKKYYLEEGFVFLLDIIHKMEEV